MIVIHMFSDEADVEWFCHTMDMFVFYGHVCVCVWVCEFYVDQKQDANENEYRPRCDAYGRQYSYRSMLSLTPNRWAERIDGRKGGNGVKGT